MPADRLLHPRCGHSEKVTMLTDMEFRVWTQYLLSADDFGVMRCSAVTLQADNDALAARKPAQLSRALNALIARGLVHLFDHQGRKYVYQRDWNTFQKVTFPRRSDNPPPPHEEVALCDAPTQELFSLHPGGKRAPKRPEKLPEDLETISEKVPTVGGPPYRLTANGLRQEANGTRQEAQPSADVWVREFIAAYPKAGQCATHLLERAFFDVVGTDRGKFDALMARLAAHKQSARWTEQNGKYIPRADRYLRDGTHLQEMPAVLAATGTDARTPQWVIEARAEKARQGAKP